MSPAYDTYRRTRFFGSLDGLRCLSILGVIWQHTGGQFGGPWTNRLPGRGYMGVELFFVISGFLITTLLLREKDSYGEVSLKNFYARRTLRIFPLYFTVLALYVVIIYFTERHSEAAQQFFHNLRFFATYTSNIFVDLKRDQDGNARTIFIFAWSLATEEQFYLAWPSAVRFSKGLRPLWIVGAVIAIDQVMRFHLADSWIAGDSRTYRVCTSVSTAICLGVLTAYLLNQRASFEKAWRILGNRWASVAALVLLLGVLAIPNTDGVAWWRLTAQISMALLVVSCVIREDHWLAPLFTNRLAQSIGAVSYGIYMLHMLAIHTSDRVLARFHLHDSLCRFAVGGLAAYGVALLSYNWYESYFLRLKSRWSRIATTHPTPALSTPAAPIPVPADVEIALAPA